MHGLTVALGVWLIGQEGHDLILAAVEEANIIINDRIYISADPRERKLYDLWLAANTRYENGHDSKKLLAVHQQIEVAGTK